MRKIEGFLTRACAGIDRIPPTRAIVLLGAMWLFLGGVSAGVYLFNSNGSGACSASQVCAASVSIDTSGNALATAPGTPAANALTVQGSWTPKWFIAANSDNATPLKASPGVVHAVQVFGIGAAPAWLKFYNTSSSPTCASSTIVKQIMIPANANTAADGAGAIAVTLDAYFSTGISYCVTANIGATDDTSVPAATYVVNIDYN